jgi:hypothetical protein
MFQGLMNRSAKMKNAREMFEFMQTPEFSEAFRRVIEADRQAEISFRRTLVDDFNRKLESEGQRPGPEILEVQKRFVGLALPTDEVHAVAAQYAEKLGRQLPPPSPSLTLDDV